MDIEIKNLRNHEFHNEPWQFRVDRGTPVGNIYYMYDENERDKVCNEYELYFRKLITYSKRTMNYLNSMLDALNSTDTSNCTAGALRNAAMPEQ